MKAYEPPEVDCCSWCGEEGPIYEILLCGGCKGEMLDERWVAPGGCECRHVIPRRWVVSVAVLTFLAGVGVAEVVGWLTWGR